MSNDPQGSLRAFVEHHIRASLAPDWRIAGREFARAAITGGATGRAEIYALVALYNETTNRNGVLVKVADSVRGLDGKIDSVVSREVTLHPSHVVGILAGFADVLAAAVGGAMDVNVKFAVKR